MKLDNEFNNPNLVYDFSGSLKNLKNEQSSNDLNNSNLKNIETITINRRKKTKKIKRKITIKKKRTINTKSNNIKEKIYFEKINSNNPSSTNNNTNSKGYLIVNMDNFRDNIIGSSSQRIKNA